MNSFLESNKAEKDFGLERFQAGRSKSNDLRNVQDPTTQLYLRSSKAARGIKGKIREHNRS